MVSYYLHRKSKKDDIRVLSSWKDQNIQKYESIMLMGKYNTEVTETKIQETYESHFLENIVKKPTSFKIPAKST